jgi:ribosomal protein L37E
MATTTAHLTCKRCGRPITSVRSIAEALRNCGYGRGCAKRIQDNAQAAAQTENPAQWVKAVDLITDGGLVHVRRGVYAVPSSDGLRTYLTAAQACSCPARKRCYHSIAVTIATARPAKAATVYALPGAPAPVDPWWNIPGDEADRIATLFAAA